MQPPNHGTRSTWTPTTMKEAGTDSFWLWGAWKPWGLCCYQSSLSQTCFPNLVIHPLNTQLSSPFQHPVIHTVIRLVNHSIHPPTPLPNYPSCYPHVIYPPFYIPSFTAVLSLVCLLAKFPDVDTSCLLTAGHEKIVMLRTTLFGSNVRQLNMRTRACTRTTVGPAIAWIGSR
jgi:hypothetical protein